jgi:hypothetical protein
VALALARIEGDFGQVWPTILTVGVIESYRTPQIRHVTSRSCVKTNVIAHRV